LAESGDSGLEHVNGTGNVLELFKNESKNHDKTTGRRYTQKMKEFALTLIIHE